MPSTYSPSLRLELIGNGEQASNWGNTTNTNLGTLLEQAITGVGNIAMAGASVTLVSGAGVSDEARNAVLILGGTLSASCNLIVPTVTKFYAIRNATSGGQNVVVKTSAGSGVTLANGYTQLMYCDGGGVVAATLAFNNTTGNISVSGIASSSGTVAVSGNLTATGNISASSGTVSASSITSAGSITATGTITGGSLSTSGSLSVGSLSVSGSISGSSISGSSISGSSINGGSISGSSLNIGSGSITTGAINASNEIRGASLVTTSGAVYLNSSLSAFMSWDGTNILLNQPLYNPNNIVSGSGYLSAGIINYNYSYTGNSVQLAPNQASSVFSKADTGAVNQIVFNNGNGQVGFINTTGSSTAYSTSSDHRLKTNVNPMVDALKTISALKPCTYEWKVSGLGGEGFIAHELQKVIPHAVMGEKDAVNEDGSIRPQGIDYGKIVVHLVAAIQELTAKVDELEKKVASN